MQRIPEPELMIDPDQVRAYAEADFEAPHSRFIELLRERLDLPEGGGRALDLGCGHGDISRRFARAFDHWQVDALDASPTVLAMAADMTATDAPIHYRNVHLPASPTAQYPLIFSNSLLHHLDDPAVLWNTVREWLVPGGQVFVMDLFRPPNRAAAEALQREYTAGEPEVLRHDFLHSLLAAYEPEEIRQQLVSASLNLTVESVSDRHVIVWGQVD